MTPAGPQRTGVPALPDPRGDEQQFRLRILEAVKELYRRQDAMRIALDKAINGAGRGDALRIENVQGIMGGSIQ